jgi:tetratricopeptide (TPR) repeat protein
MTEHPFKPILLDLLRQAQISQNAFFQELSPDELAAIGTPELWSAKDHAAHMTFWRQRLVLILQAVLRQEPVPQADDFEQLNPIIFEEQRYHPWPDILAESDQAYADLLAVTEQLTEEDLTTFNRFDWTFQGEPLYTAYMGNCYEHTQQHLAQYLLDRHDPERAIETYEVWANRVVEADVPDALKAFLYYNLACFYATHDRLEQALPFSQQAFALYPPFREFARTDPDLTALHLDQFDR